MPEITTYVVHLDRLDANKAVFRAPDTAFHSTVLELERDAWVKLDRPSMIEIAPKPYPPTTHDV